ncbi:unnamed protein product [Diamesa serratosioi]
MTINSGELIRAVAVVADKHNIKCTVKTSAKYSLIVAGSVFLGGILMGPVGLALGGTAGGLYSYQKSKGVYKKSIFINCDSQFNLCIFVVGQFRSGAEILINDLSDEEKQRLVEHVVAAFREFQPQDIAYLIPLLTSSVQFQGIILSKIIHFLTNEMNLQIVD